MIASSYRDWPITPVSRDCPLHVTVPAGSRTSSNLVCRYMPLHTMMPLHTVTGSRTSSNLARFSSSNLTGPGSARSLTQRAFTSGSFATSRLRSQSAEVPSGMPPFASDGALTRQSAGPSCAAPPSRGWEGMRFRWRQTPTPKRMSTDPLPGTGCAKPEGGPSEQLHALPTVRASLLPLQVELDQGGVAPSR